MMLGNIDRSGKGRRSSCRPAMVRTCPRDPMTHFQGGEGGNGVERSFDEILHRPVREETLHLSARDPEGMPMEDADDGSACSSGSYSRIAQQRSQHKPAHHDRSNAFVEDGLLFGHR